MALQHSRLIAKDTKETEVTKINGKIDLSTIKDDLKESYATHEALSIIRQYHNDVLSDFDKQMQAVKRKKTEQERKSTERKSNRKKS